MQSWFRKLLWMPVLLLSTQLQAQSSNIWTLQQCVDYAVSHNISIQQNVLNERLAALTLQQSRLSQIPNANISTGYGRSFGRSVDPTTNQFVDGSSYDFLSVGGNVDVLLFGWFQRRNTILKNDLTHQAAIADLDQLKDDVSLNVATGFLRTLLAKEQVWVNQKQVNLSAEQLAQTQKFATAGRVPELNVAQLTSQLATDSANLITAISDYNSSILDLKALLNLDFAVPFELQTPDMGAADVSLVANHTPEGIYAEAAKHFGAIKSSELNLAAAEKQLKAAKGALYPQLSFNAQIGSNYATTYKDYGTPVITGEQLSGTYVKAGGVIVPVYQPTYQIPIDRTTPLNDQIGNNFRHTYSINLNIPVFNAWQAQLAVRQSKIDVVSKQLNEYQAVLNLKQNVYKAYNDARNSLQKYYAAQRADEAAQRAFDFAQKRYDLGLTNTVEYLITQNNQYRAASSVLSAKYDLIFRLKVIDYYLGNPLKL